MSCLSVATACVNLYCSHTACLVTRAHVAELQSPRHRELELLQRVRHLGSGSHGRCQHHCCGQYPLSLCDVITGVVMSTQLWYISLSLCIDCTCLDCAMSWLLLAGLCKQLGVCIQSCNHRVTFKNRQWTRLRVAW